MKNNTHILPNFLIVGAAKSGTTSIYHYLSQHPQIFMSPVKEPGFFAYRDPYIEEHFKGATRFTAKSMEQYRALFEGVSHERAIGEASTIYLESPAAPTRICEQLPGVKLIVSLRNPVDRAHSGYVMHVRKSLETRMIDDAFDSDARYVKVGFYYEKLKRYIDIFGKEKIKIGLFDELISQPERFIEELLQFLNLDTTLPLDISAHHNKGTYPRIKWLNRLLVNPIISNYLAPVLPTWFVHLGKKAVSYNRTSAPDLPYEVKVKLEKIYRDDILRVQDLIDRDLSVWLSEK